MSEPVELVVVQADDVDMDATAPADEVVNGNLQRPATEYVGSVARLHRRVGGLSGRRLVTLTGSGGVGKSRTAVEIGWLSSEQFPGGVWLVELAPVGAGDAVPAAVATALGVQVPRGSTVSDAIVAWMQPRPTLLILDNCEHVLDAAASLVMAIGAGAPASTVLATSREPLGVAGEIVRRVPSLDVGTDAVLLFGERAAAVSEGFVLDDTNRDTVTALCARLDGIPLAIELAAARVRALSPAEILTRLDDRFRLLRGSGRGGQERHQTLLATVTWSVQLLSAEERCLFERLSVFAGTFTLADAETVCGMEPLYGSEVVDELTGLVDKSMLAAETGPDGVTRYRLLETLRQYGEQALATAGDAAGLRDRHLAHFLEQAQGWYARQATAQEPVANRAFTANWDNLRAAFDWALACGRWHDVADLLHTIFWFAYQTSRWEHREWAAAARAAGPDTSKIATVAVVTWGVLAADSEAVADAVVSLDPDITGLTARDTEQIWLARAAAAALITGDRDEIERFGDWLRERDPRSDNPLVEAWILHRYLVPTLTEPDPAVVRRIYRLGQSGGSPSVRALTGYMLHGFRHRNPTLGEGLDLGDPVEGLQQAIACSRAAGNRLVEAACHLYLLLPLADRGDRGDAAVLRATLQRVRDFRYDILLSFLAASMALWLVRIGRPQAATIVDGYLQTHIPTRRPAIQPTIERLHQLLDRGAFPAERSRGAAMTHTELSDYLEDELAQLS